MILIKNPAFVLSLILFSMIQVPCFSVPSQAAESKKIEHVICSGPGCLRLLTYLKGHNRIVAVDSIETRGATVDARPYAIANPQFKKFPLFGELRGHDNLELIAGLNPSPDIIFKTFIGANMDSANLTAKTGITVSNLNYGNLTYGMADLRKSLRTMGGIMGLNQRAEEVIDYFENIENDLRERTKGLASEEIFNCYLGGVAMKGPHGLQSTEPAFAPFIFTNTRNVAASLAKKQAVSYANVSKEQLVFWNPQVIFLDASTLQMGPESNALYELKNDAAYKDLSAVKEGRIYVLFPYYSYQQNFESAFANAYYVGKVLYPERFKDVDPLEKGEAIATFLNGAPAFRKMKEQYKGLPFSKI